MTINEIQAALSAKAQKMNFHPVAPVTAKASAATKNPVAAERPAPAAVVSSQSQNGPKPALAAEPEMKPAAKARKPAARKAKPATVVPMDGIEAVVAAHLKAGVDYDVIPGCGRKPALLKAGAEKLAAIYGYRSTSRIVNRIERYDQLFVLYEVQTTIYDSDGHVVAEGLGSCNSKERRYQKGDFAASLNTALKMAKKRSYVDAILSATHASGVFTQDIEDIAAEARMKAIG